MRELWDHKLGFALALVLALLVAGRMAGLGLFPPSLDGSTGPGRAVTHVLVDTPQSTTVDLRQSTYDIEGLTNRALLVGNAMASPTVRERIAVRAGVAAKAIRTTTPLNAEYPEGVAETGGPQGASGLSPASLYRLDVQANTTVPVVDINTEAPTREGAVKLADAAAAGLASYLTATAESDETPAGARLDVVQLGRAQPLATAGAAGPISTSIVFALVFAAASATVLFVARVRKGWRASGEALRANPVS
ncbi:MAG: hypothetical protein ACRDLL_15550 [Solirubrobacterales bacterium]